MSEQARQRVIVVIHERDDSHIQSDYHAEVQLGRWVLCQTDVQQDRIAVLKATASRFPSLQDLHWEERREKYAMGRGYYIRAGLPMTAPDHSGRQRATWYIVRYSTTRFEKDTPSWPEKAQEDGVTCTGEITVTVQRNHEKNGVEVIFSAKPALPVRQALKSRGFRWSRRQGLWWARFSELRWEWVQTLATAMG
jgi:hypothetical protein